MSTWPATTTRTIKFPAPAWTNTQSSNGRLSRFRAKGTCVILTDTFKAPLNRESSPYFGQSAWFQRFHSEKIPSAIERYNNEIKRVFGVLDGVLSKQKYLVGDKVTIADLSFISWNMVVFMLLIPDIDIEKNYPSLAR